MLRWWRLDSRLRIHRNAVFARSRTSAASCNDGRSKSSRAMAGVLRARPPRYGGGSLTAAPWVATEAPSSTPAIVAAKREPVVAVVEAVPIPAVRAAVAVVVGVVIKIIGKDILTTRNGITCVA